MKGVDTRVFINHMYLYINNIGHAEQPEGGGAVAVWGDSLHSTAPALFAPGWHLRCL
jgi:hypothetical protein